MKSISLFLLFLCSCSLFAARETKTYEAALKGCPDDGIVAFIYGPDWEKQGPAMLKTLLPKIRGVCGNANIVALPFYQTPNDRERKEAAEKQHRFVWTKDIHAFPALVMQTGKGNTYYVIQGDAIYAPPEKICELIKAKLELYRQQRKLVQQANKAKGVRKAELYGEAASIQGINPPKDALKVVLENDPKRTTIYPDRIEFNIYKLLLENMYFEDKKPDKRIYTVEETLEKLKKLTAGTRYLPWQKQEIYAACTGHLRRKKYNPQKLKKLYEEMIKIDPDSVWSSYAQESIRIWCKTGKK